MKVLWISNAPYVQSGYGVQTQIFTRLLKQAGHEPTVFGFYGHRGATMNWDGVKILPASLDAWGNDMIPLHIQQHEPDVVVGLCDVWVWSREAVAQMWAWAPVDHEPMPAAVRERLEAARGAWAMSRFAEREMRAAGLPTVYVPHGVDTATYQPGDRAAARKVWGVPEGAFLAVMVAANKGYPARKSFDRVLKAWSEFVKTKPDALLYIHALPGGAHDGIDLIECAKFYGVPDANLRLPDMYRMVRGDYDPQRMNALYNAADVLLAPSAGEGFGIPVIEAQAAGCPVVVSDFSAQAELGEAGYKVPINRMDDMVYTLQDSEQCAPKVSEIVRGIEWGFSMRSNSQIRARAREFAMEYDARTVFEKHMLPALELAAADQRGMTARRSRTAARLARRSAAQVEHGRLSQPITTNGHVCITETALG